MRLFLLALCLMLILTIPSTAQQKSLADAARDARRAKAGSQPKTQVITDDELPRDGDSSANSFSADKQAYCDQLKNRGDSTADSVCTLLHIDMGKEYEATTARYMALADEYCNVNHGELTPDPPPTPGLASQWKELKDLRAKFEELKKSQSQSLAASINSAVQQENARQLTVQANPTPDAKALAGPDPKLGPRAVAEQARFRSLRMYYDSLRIGEACSGTTR